MGIFEKVRVQKPRFNTFNLSHTRKFDAGFGDLKIDLLIETVPNDTIMLSASHMVRMAPTIAPVMHDVHVYHHYFFVPNRITWPRWEKFINGGKDGEQTPAYPTVSIQNASPGSTIDHMGVPTGLTPELTVSAIPFWAFQKCWYDFYRDQNLVDEISLFENDGGLPDGPQIAFNTGLLTANRNRAHMHDYFTASLPWTQRGPEATIPLGTSAPLQMISGNNTQSTVRDADGNALGNTGQLSLSAAVSDGSANFGGLRIDVGSGNFRTAQIDPTGHLQVDLSTATAASINDLRRAFRLQEWLELNARAGARYNETIKAHFGIDPGDARLQRPIFIGGYKTPLVISEVLQTSSTGQDTTPQANMAGHGISVGGKNAFKYKCKEHGYVIGIMSIIPSPAYQQGIPRHLTKFDKFDYYWRSFANIGEQAVYNKEIYADGTSEDENVWGYVPRYAEYKYAPSTVHGQFRSTLDFWHLGRKFSARPVLNNDFVTVQPGEYSRIFAVTEAGTEQFYCYVHNQVKARRPMPYFGTPTI